MHKKYLKRHYYITCRYVFHIFYPQQIDIRYQIKIIVEEDLLALETITEINRFMSL